MSQCRCADIQKLGNDHSILSSVIQKLQGTSEAYPAVTTSRDAMTACFDRSADAIYLHHPTVFKSAVDTFTTPLQGQISAALAGLRRHRTQLEQKLERYGNEDARYHAEEAAKAAAAAAAATPPPRR